MLGTVYALVRDGQPVTLWDVTGVTGEDSLELSCMCTIVSGEINRVGPVSFRINRITVFSDCVRHELPMSANWLKVPEHLYRRTYPHNSDWSYKVDWRRDEPKIRAWVQEQL